jgi:translin
VSEFAAQVAAVAAQLAEASKARETGLTASRATIRSCSSAIRAIHRLDPERAAALVAEAEANLRIAQEALAPFPSVAHAGFLHDAEKEFVEANACAALVAGRPLPGAEELRVGFPAWLNGLAEAASELRRHALDRLRDAPPERAEALLAAMDDVFGELVTIDLPDALTGGLRRTLDSLRAVIERTRGDITTAVLQDRLRAALDRGLS